MKTDVYQRVTNVIVAQLEKGVRPALVIAGPCVNSASECAPMTAYFIRRRGDGCAVIRLHTDNREEVVQDDLTLIEAEILCAALNLALCRCSRALMAISRHARIS